MQRQGIRTGLNALSLLAVPLSHSSHGAYGQISFGEADHVYSGNSLLMHVSDLNSDGRNDLVHAGQGGLGTHINSGQGFFEPGEPSIRVSGGVAAFDVADFDLDGRPDLFWATGLQSYPQELGWWSSRINRVDSLICGSRARAVALGDFDRDGDQDAVTCDLMNYTSQGAFLRLLQNSAGAFEVSRSIPLPFNASKDCATGDFNGDGWLDLAITGFRGNNGEWGWTIYSTWLAVYLNDQRGGFDREFYGDLGLRSPWQPERIATGDLDGDGDLDLAVGLESHSSQENAQLFILTNDGTGRAFEILPPIRLNGMGGQICVADLNTDGQLDIVAASDSLECFRNRGDLEFTLDGERALPGFVQSLSIGDLTGSGTIDVAFCGSAGGYWMTNTTPYDGPRLRQFNVRRGAIARFVVFGAEPSESVHILFSLAGFGPTLGQPLLGGMTLDLNRPFVVAESAVADGRGRAAFSRPIPSSGPLQILTTQAVIRRGPNGESSAKTPFQTALIQD